MSARSPSPPSSFLAELRGMSAQLLITVAGIVSAIATVAANVGLQQAIDLNLLDLSVAFVIPAGAILGGFGAASGYYFAARATETLPTRRLLLEMMAIGMSTWFLAQWVSYALLRFPNGALVRDVVPFWSYFRLHTEHMQLVINSQGGRETGRTGELGALGYMRELLQIAGFLCGGLVMWKLLAAKEACAPCSRYAKTTALLQRVSAATLEEVLRRAGTALPQLAEQVKRVTGKGRMLGLNLNIAECPACGRHWIRPGVVLAAGNQSTVHALAPHDVERPQAEVLYRLAS